MERNLDLEDFQELMDSAHKKIKELSLANQTQEVCGFVVKNDGEISAVKARNESPDKENFFMISPLQFLSIRNSNEEVLSVFHSHITGSAEPSEFDKTMSTHCDLDFLIYSIEEDNFYTHKK